MVVVARPPRAADPLLARDRIDPRVVGYGVVVGVMEIVRPVVVILGTFLLDHVPIVFALHQSNAVGHQHAQDFRPGDLGR